jgi:hypothetical protein
VVLTVACVEVGNYLGRGAEYVEKLRASVASHLKLPHRFECVREGPPNWWAKVELFRPGRFRGRVLYLDLDNFIVGPLDDLIERKGIIHLGMWGWTKNDYGSGVMVWDAGEHGEIFTGFTSDVPRRLRGDQDWLTELGGWDALPFPTVCSAKYHCKAGPPAGASVVCCHGPKKPHLFEEGWARSAWA